MKSEGRLIFLVGIFISFPVFVWFKFEYLISLNKVCPLVMNIPVVTGSSISQLQLDCELI